MNMSDSTTININLTGDDGTKNPNQESAFAYPWQILGPWIPICFPFGFPFFLKEQNSSGINSTAMEIESCMLEATVLGHSAKVKKGIDIKDLHRHLKEDVMQKIIKVKNMVELEKIMAKTFDAYPSIKEFIQKKNEEFGGNGNDDPTVLGLAWIWWVVRIIITIILILVAVVTGN